MTKKIKVYYDGTLYSITNRKYEPLEDFLEMPSLKYLYQTAKNVIKKDYKEEYKQGKRFFLRDIERFELRLIDTAAKEIRVKI